MYQATKYGRAGILCNFLHVVILCLWLSRVLARLISPRNSPACCRECPPFEVYAAASYIQMSNPLGCPNLFCAYVTFLPHRLNRRYKTWQSAYETIMLKYMDLCVQLQQHRQAKDGLHQYRNMAQQQAPASLEVTACPQRKHAACFVLRCDGVEAIHCILQAVDRCPCGHQPHVFVISHVCTRFRCCTLIGSARLTTSPVSS